MKIGIITKPNQKGQIVIPKIMRQALKINPSVNLNLILWENGIFISPIQEVITPTDKENSYPKLLEKTQGGWLKENWPALRKKRQQTELKASKQRKKLW